MFVVDWFDHFVRKEKGVYFNASGENMIKIFKELTI